MGKPRISRRKACLTLRQLEEATGYSRSTLNRLPKAQVESLANGLADGTWRKEANTDESKAPGTLAQFEGRFLATHTQIAMLRYEIRDSHPEIAAKLTEILAKTRPWCDWLEA
jgi:hypothetical protein